MITALENMQNIDQVPDHMLPPEEDPALEYQDDITEADNEVEEVVDDIMEHPEVKEIVKEYSFDGVLDVDKLLARIDSDPGEFTIFPFALKKSELLKLKERLQDEQRRRTQESQGRADQYNQDQGHGAREDASRSDQGDEVRDGGEEETGRSDERTKEGDSGTRGELSNPPEFAGEHLDKEAYSRNKEIVWSASEVQNQQPGTVDENLREVQITRTPETPPTGISPNTTSLKDKDTKNEDTSQVVKNKNTEPNKNLIPAEYQDQIDNLKEIVAKEYEGLNFNHKIAELNNLEKLTQDQIKERDHLRVILNNTRNEINGLRNKIDRDLISEDKEIEIRKLIEQTRAQNDIINQRVSRLKSERNAKEKSLQNRVDLFGDRKVEEERKSGLQPMFAGEIFEASSENLQAALKPFNDGIKKAETERKRNDQLLDEKIALVLSGAQTKMQIKQLPRTDEKNSDILYRVGDKENPLAINDKFNEDLSRMISGNLKIGHIFELGNPSNILQAAGIPNLPIEMSSQRLLDKSKQKNHKFDLSKVKDLPKALQNPIAIFSYGDKSKAVNIIVEIEYKGKKFLVGLSLDPAIKGIKLGINSIRSVFPKDTHEWVNWIIQGKGLYFDKEKVLNILTNSRIPADVAFGLPGNQVQQDKAELSDVNITKKPENANKEKTLDWLNKQRYNSAEVKQLFRHATNIINTFKNPTIPSENNNLFRAIGERGASRLSNAEKVLDGLRAAKEMESIGNIDKLKDVVLNLFHKASKGDISGKSIKIGDLTANGRDYLAELAGIDMKQYVSFVINPSDLRHIYNEHYGANEKDRGQNYPLIDEDIRNMVDVILNPEKIVSFKEDGITKFIFLAKSPQDGAYNLVEVYGDKRGNLSAKSLYNTKKDVSHRAMIIIKQSRLSTSKTSGAILSETNIPQLFESIKSFDAKTIRLATGWERGKDGKWRYETRDIELKKDIDFIGKLKTQKEAFTEEVPLTDVIEDKELFNSYPQLKEVKLVFYNYGSHPELTGTGAFSDFTEKIIGLFQFHIGTIESNNLCVLYNQGTAISIPHWYD